MSSAETTHPIELRDDRAGRRKDHRRQEVYPLLPDYEADYVTPAPDGKPWRKACKECAFRTNDPQGLGLDYAHRVRYSHPERDGLFYCTHRLDGDHNRICACYAACRAGETASAARSFVEKSVKEAGQ